jgi:hypothetical protein
MGRNLARHTLQEEAANTRAVRLLDFVFSCSLKRDCSLKRTMKLTACPASKLVDPGVLLEGIGGNRELSRQEQFLHFRKNISFLSEKVSRIVNQEGTGGLTTAEA